MTVTKLWTIQALCDVTLCNLVSSYSYSEELLCFQLQDQAILYERVFDSQDEDMMILWKLGY